MAKNENIVGYQAELSRTIRDLAFYYSTVDKLDPRVIELLEQAETMLLNLITRDSLDTSYQSDLAGSLLSHAEALKSRGRFQDALTKTNQALQRLEGLLESNSEDSNAREKLHFAVAAHAELNNRIGDFESALSDWDRAIEIAPPAFKVFDQMQRARTRVLSGNVLEGIEAADSILAELDTSDTGAYQTVAIAAQTFALAAQGFAAQLDPELRSASDEFADRAMELIRTRVESAPVKAEYFETCQDFDGIRTRADFNELLENLRSTPQK